MQFPLLDNANTPIAIILYVVGGVLFLAALGIAIYMIVSSKKSAKGNGLLWLEALGGKENIEDVSGVGSRVTLVLKDKEKINRDQLKTLGVSSVLTMANKTILVIENKAVSVADKIRKEIL